MSLARWRHYGSESSGAPTLDVIVLDGAAQEPRGGGIPRPVIACCEDHLIATIDWNDGVTQYRYDLTRNLEIGRTEGLKNQAGVVTTADTLTTTTSWHATYRLSTRLTTWATALVSRPRMGAVNRCATSAA